MPAGFFHVLKYATGPPALSLFPHQNVGDAVRSSIPDRPDRRARNRGGSRGPEFPGRIPRTRVKTCHTSGVCGTLFPSKWLARSCLSRAAVRECDDRILSPPPERTRTDQLGHPIRYTRVLPARSRHISQGPLQVCAGRVGPLESASRSYNQAGAGVSCRDSVKSRGRREENGSSPVR